MTSPTGTSKLAISGRIVTMDASFSVIPHGTVFVDSGKIVAVQNAAQAAPPGFDGVATVDPGVTIYPGLIELHNHLSYNALRLWAVPKQYGDRGQWAGTPQYQQLITGPMKVLGTSPGLLPALVRYVESKCLVAGVTTSQGIALFSNAGVRRYYRGTIRVVESTSDPALPEAATRIADVVAKDRQSFLDEIGRRKCFLLHLAEGTDSAARAHFAALQFPDGSWAIAASLAGIHCVPLTSADFEVMAKHGASMVWSPLSNLLLYGRTADVAAARNAGVRIGIGSDWAPSGSKNLFGELKVARVYSGSAGLPFTDRDLLAMATRDAAAILRWDAALGSIEVGKKADLVAISGVAGDPYASFFTSSETAISLVVIDGTARYGDAALMAGLNPTGETVSVGGKPRMVFFDSASQDPAVASISLGAAQQTLDTALAQLPQHAKAHPGGGSTALQTAAPEWRLALDELGGTGMDVRPLIGGTGLEMTRQPALVAAQGAPPPPPLTSLVLDALTVADDSHWIDRLSAEANLPAFLVPGLKAL